jgi:hypothetical protein
MKFKGFKPEAMQRIASKLGYSGDMDKFDAYLAANPDKQSMMNSYKEKALNMAKGGSVPKFASGGLAALETEYALLLANPPKGYGDKAEETRIRMSNLEAQINKLRADAANVAASAIEAPATIENTSGKYVVREFGEKDKPKYAVYDPSGKKVNEYENKGTADQSVAAMNNQTLGTGKFSVQKVGEQYFVYGPKGNRQGSAYADQATAQQFADARNAENAPEPGPSITDVTTDRMTNPTLPEGTKVVAEDIDVKKDQLLGSNTGQLKGNVTADVSTVKKVDTATAGKKGTITEAGTTATVGDVKDITDQTKAATGDVSKKVVAAQGKLSDKAVADAIGMDEDYIQQVKAGTLKVTRDQLAKAALATNIPEAEIATFLGTTPQGCSCYT